ncbi:MAG: FAD-dependent oxidoreductase [Acidobacteria bacterium]|nr:FAD-dependent oxidoreductase [Acidobacteriota bacterium]
MSEPKRVLIVGGVAGGASCAARLRRLDEFAEIVIFERGPHVSFANCGLPYYVGDVIREEAKLLVATPELFRQRFRIEVRTQAEVVAIDRAAREIEVLDHPSGERTRERYDALVLSPGAAPLRPPIEGLDLPGVFSLRTIPDSRAIRDWMEQRPVRRAAIVGGGYIGLEMAENLARRGVAVTVVEIADQLLPVLDPEMAVYVSQHLAKHHVQVRLGQGVASFEQTSEGLLVRTPHGAAIPADLVLLSAGVRPETQLARAAGLELGERGGIRVDDRMRTSDPHIWAVGDAVETRDVVTGEERLAPLAGPANRQGRIAADSICGRPSAFRGVQATAVCGCFGLTVAMTGATEKTLERLGWDDYEAVYLHPTQHAGYYPGAKPIHLKLLFRKSDGRILGAQAAGEEGVERRIDVLAMAIQKQATVFDLEETELCYAPQYGAAKDAVNMAGMIAANVLRGDAEQARWSELEATSALIVDVRDPHEYARDYIDGAINIPLDQLRDRLGELPRDREIWVNCAAGQRSYYALRVLRQRGFAVRNLSGGYQTFAAWYP